jgi:molybdate transport system substrate-binding protein
MPDFRRALPGAVARLCAACAFAIAAAAVSPLAAATEIKVMASVAPKNAYLELQPLFEKATGHKVTTIWAPTVEMMTRLKGGEQVDLVLIASSNMDELQRVGVISDKRWNVVSSGIGVAVKQGAPKPDISSPEKLKQALIDAKSVAYSTGPSGVYLVSLFERMGLTETLKPKITAITGTPVAVLVAKGDYEIGFQQIPEIVPVQGIDYLGPLPPGAQSMTSFPMGVHAKADAEHAEAATAWVKFLTTPEAGAVMRKWGLVPAGI